MADIISIHASGNGLSSLTTEYLKRLWDYMGEEDGSYEDGAFVVAEAGHVVNGVFIDDVHAEMNRRGEGRYVAV